MSAAPSNPSNGWSYYDSTDNKSYIYYDSSWNILSQDGLPGTDGSSLNSLISIEDESEGSNCETGGKKINYGIDDDGNGTLASGEVDGYAYVCNWATGSTGATGATGATGDNGTSSRIRYSHYCNALLENTAYYFRYRVYQFKNNDVYIQGEIYGTSFEVADSVMYGSTQNGWLTAPIYINYDVSGTANYGYWVISMDRTTLITTIVYYDTDISVGSLTWVEPSSDCTSTTLY